MDQLLAMRVFSLAVESGSIAAAGRQLALSPAMAGRHLRALEARLDVRLLQRSTRHLALTEAGERYLQRCKRILAELDDADREVSDRDKAVRGNLRVSAPPTFAALHLGPSVVRYLEDHPHVSLDLTLSDRHVELLAAGIDVAIRVGALSDENLTVRRLASCRMLACASPAYLEARGVPATPADMTAHRCLAFRGAVSPGDWTFTGREGRPQTPKLAFAVVADSMDMLKAAAVAGGGIAYGPGFAFVDALQTGALVRVLAEWSTASLPIHAVFPTARYIPRMVRHFVDRLASDFSGLPPWERW